MKLGHLVNKIPVQKVHKKSDLLIDSETLLGVEVEVENCLKYYSEDQKEAYYWTHKEDNSLRNYGREFVFAEPLFGYDAVRAIEFLCKQAGLLNWKISNLCGLHVHVDIRELELEEVRNFCVTFALVEPLVYNWVGDDRAENIYCQPWNIAENDLGPISALIKQQVNGSVIEFIKAFHKYSGLNLQSIAHFGTAEFRMLKTTFDVKKIIKWINILLSIKKYAKSTGLRADDIVNRLKKVGAFEFACDVFGIQLATEMWYKQYPKDVVLIVGPIAEWFLDNARDNFIKSKGPAGGFDWVRKQKLNDFDPQQGEHKGFERWRHRKMAGKQELKTPPKAAKEDMNALLDILAIQKPAKKKPEVVWAYDDGMVKIKQEDHL